MIWTRTFLVVAVVGTVRAAAADDLTLRGRVLYSGPVPEPKVVKTASDPRCHQAHPGGLSQTELRTKEGGLADVLVHVVQGAPNRPPVADGPVLDQKGCLYLPRVLAVQVGQPLRIRNSDPTLHNVHLRPTLNAEFNIGQPRQGMVSTRTFDKAETMIPIGCDVHPWMRAHLSVLGHPFFAVSAEDGRFEITGLPPGDYEIEARHPSLPPRRKRVRLSAQAEPLKLELSGP